MGKTTNAERCKKYREKNKEKYQKNDRLRKKNARVTLKVTNTSAYENLKLAERLKKRQYHLKKKQEKAVSNESSSNPALVNSSSFKYKCTRNRVLNRVKKALPGSPSKRNEVIQSMTKKFNLRISYQPTKRGRKKNVLLQKEQEWLIELLVRGDISYTNPGHKHSVCVKIDGVKQFITKRYLLWTIREILEIANGSDAIETSETFHDKFQKKITFRQLHDFLKFHKEYIFNRSIPHWSCLCEVCENVVMRCVDINKAIPKKEKKLPENPHDIVEKFKCNNGGEPLYDR